MNRGGFRRARLAPEKTAIDWKSTAGQDDTGSESVGDLSKASLKAAKVVAPVAAGAAMSTPQGQTGKASAMFLSRLLKDRQARQHAARVAREDKQARDAVKVIRAEHKKTTSIAKPSGAAPAKRDGKGDNLLAPEFANSRLPPPKGSLKQGSHGRTRILHYWERGGF